MPLEEEGESLLFSFPAVNIQDGVHLHTKKWVLCRHQICWHIDHGLATSRTVRNKWPVVEAVLLWWFVIVVRTDEDA